MTPKITRWAIEYWHEDTKTVSCFCSTDGAWREAPKDLVIYAYIQRSGTGQWNDTHQKYTQILCGFDNYFFKQTGDDLCFGGWNDDGRPGQTYMWYPDERWITIEKTTDQPAGITDDFVVRGVMVHPPWSYWLDFTGRNTNRKRIPRCVEWMKR